MAIQVINDPYRSRSGSLASSLGQGLGSGLSTGLQALASLKLQQLQQRNQQMKGYQAFKSLGYPENEALALSSLPENLQRSWIANYGPEGSPQGPSQLQQSIAEPIQQEQPSLRQSLGKQAPQQPSLMDTLSGLEQSISGLTPSQFNQYSSLLGQLGGQQMPGQQSSENLNVSAPDAVTPEAVGTASRVQPQIPQVPQRRLTRQQEKEAKLEDYRLKKLGLEERKASAAEQARINRETEGFYKKTLEDEKAGKETKITLDKMEKLIDKGNLPPAALFKFVKDIEANVPSTHGAAVGGGLGGYFGGPLGAAVGAGIGALINPIASLVESGIKYVYPDTEQFEKLSNSFIRGAKAIFGQRVTDQDLRIFLTTLPNLTQTENGKRQIINNIRILNDAAQIRAKALKDILKENKGKRPENLPLLVEERTNKELDKLANEFVA